MPHVTFLDDNAPLYHTHSSTLPFSIRRACARARGIETEYRLWGSCWTRTLSVRYISDENEKNYIAPII